MALFSGRNIYCAWLCPFLGVQELANRVSGVRCSANGAENKLRSTRNFLLWFGLLLVFTYRNPALGNYEPFGTIFGFTGTGLTWLILAAVMVAAIFRFRFWCNYFCPVGAALDICAKINRNIKKLVNRSLSKDIKEDTAELTN
jgi:polyferredoxin